VGSSTALVECTIFENEAAEGAAVWDDGLPATDITSCTIALNRATRGAILAGVCGRIENTIISHSTAGEAVAHYYQLPTLSCSDIYGNAGGDWTYQLQQQYGIRGNISQDPLFCDPANGDFSLDCNSPCAAENNPECGQIGAWPVGCGPSAVVETTWGAVKALFRE